MHLFCSITDCLRVRYNFYDTVRIELKLLRFWSEMGGHCAIYTAVQLLILIILGWSPGLEVVGGGSCSECCGFESQHHIPDGHFAHLFVVKIVMFVWKDKNKWKRGRGWPIFKKPFDNEPKLFAKPQVSLTAANRNYFAQVSLMVLDIYLDAIAKA